MPLSRNFKTARVPDVFVNGLIVDPRQLGLVSKRNDDASGQFAAILPTELQPFVGIVEGKLPLTVEIEPFFANKLWTGILGARSRCCVGHRRAIRLTGDLPGD